MSIKIGDKVPNFSTKNQQGETIHFSDYQGQKVVLYFYPKDNTPGCTDQACDLRDNIDKLSQSGYTILGISTDSEKKHQNFIKKFNLPFTLLSDTDKSVHDIFGTWAEKQMFGRKYMGTLRKTYLINEKGVVTRIIEKVKTKTHATQILNGV